MKYEVKQVEDKKVWEDFSLSHHPNTFLQSWSWGEFNVAMGRKIWRFGAFDKDKLVGIALAICMESRFGRYIYIPRGPVWDFQNWSIFEALFAQIKVSADSEGVIFIKLDPQILDETQVNSKFKQLGFQRSVAYVQVEDAWLLDLSKTEEELLAEMRKTTRYLIRNEPKQGIVIESSTDQKEAIRFVDLLYHTASRKQFSNHPREYYLKQFEILSNEGQEVLFTAKKGGKVLAMAMICYYGEAGYYLHGASNPEEKVSVGYSLQWEAIKEAKRRGCKYYSFWGVVKDKNFVPGHPWYGFSLFKKGFGGFKESYIRAQDYPLSSKYYIYRHAEKLRRLKNRVQTGYWED